MKTNKKAIQRQLQLVRFGEYYKSLKGAEKLQFRRSTISNCLIVSKTFENWVNEASSPSIAQRLKLIELHKIDFAFAERNRKKISFKTNENTITTQSTERQHA